jgi:ADP-ribose pyrophosphatase YjhB (NUDIX family)
MDKKSLLSGLELAIPDASSGLGKDLFLAISRLTPIVNVDLLIQKSFSGRLHTLLSWRSDEFYLGWHFPGGVLRFKERLESRVKKVGEQELSSLITSIKGPLEVNEFMNPSRDVRGHFLSLLYTVELDSYPAIGSYNSTGESKPGTLRWFAQAPNDLLKQHKVYESYFSDE